MPACFNFLEKHESNAFRGYLLLDNIIGHLFNSKFFLEARCFTWISFNVKIPGCHQCHRYFKTPNFSSYFKPCEDLIDLHASILKVFRLKISVMGPSMKIHQEFGKLWRVAKGGIWIVDLATMSTEVQEKQT
jgi:hypothetical protein